MRWRHQMAPTPTLINAKAGAAASDQEIGRRVSDALAGAGIMADVALLGADEVETRCRALADRGEPLVIVGGGDGTLRAAASALAGSSTALGILPLGTLNHFAQDLGVPSDFTEAATVIARGREKRVDVAEMNGEVFINNSAIGLYPLMLVDRDLQRRRLGRSKRLAMIVASLRTLFRFNHQRLSIAINDRAAQLDTPLLFVGNNDYRLDLGAPGQRERLDKAHLCVMVMRKKTRRGLIAASLRALVGRSRPDDMVRIEGVERLTVTSRRSTLLVSLDGEVVPAAPPLRYTIRKRALRVIGPARNPRRQPGVRGVKG